MSKTPQAVEQYFDAIQRGDLEGVVALFADQAAIAHANPTAGPEVIGRDNIRQFFREHVLPRKPRVTHVDTLSAGNRCSVEFVVHTDDSEPLETVDVFEVDDAGGITRIDTYVRGALGSPT